MPGDIEVTRKEEFVRDPRSGKWVKRIRHIVVNPQDLSIDELPPPGVQGPLSETPPPTLGGVTSNQLDRSRKVHRQPGIEKSLPEND